MAAAARLALNEPRVTDAAMTVVAALSLRGPLIARHCRALRYWPRYWRSEPANYLGARSINLQACELHLSVSIGLAACAGWRLAGGLQAALFSAQAALEWRGNSVTD